MESSWYVGLTASDWNSTDELCTFSVLNHMQLSYRRTLTGTLKGTWITTVIQQL